MKHIKKYIDHSNIDKVQWIKVKPVKSSVESKKLKELISLATEELFQVFYLGDPFNKKLDKERPILKYGLNEILLHTLLSFNKLKDSEYYNKSVEGMKSADKKSWHEMLGEKDYLPLTVTDAKDVKKSNLKFPIICKPAEGHSGLGIMKFDSFEEFEKEISKPECELDTFSEMVKDIDTEYRFVFCKNDLFLAHERIPIKKENKTISTKKADEELKFLYVEQDLEKFEDKDKINDILIDFKKYVDLDFFALDILLDKNGKYWLIESNSNIGMGGNTLARAYEAIYKDYYKKDLPENKQRVVDKICKEYYEEILKLYPEEIKDSKIPMTYSVNESWHEDGYQGMSRAEAEREAFEDKWDEDFKTYDLPIEGKVHKGDMDLGGLFDKFYEWETEDRSTEDLVGEYVSMPETVNGDFDCSSNATTVNNLVALDECIPSKEVKGSFFLNSCSVTSFEKALPKIGKDIDIGHNKLENLKGLPKKVNGDLAVGGNPLESLIGCPEIIMGYFSIFSHKKDQIYPKKLLELPKYIKGDFDINDKKEWGLTKEDLYKNNKLISPSEISFLMVRKPKAAKVLEVFCDKKKYKELLKKYKDTVNFADDFGIFD